MSKKPRGGDEIGARTWSAAERRSRRRSGDFRPGGDPSGLEGSREQGLRAHRFGVSSLGAGSQGAPRAWGLRFVRPGLFRETWISTRERPWSSGAQRARCRRAGNRTLRTVVVAQVQEPHRDADRWQLVFHPSRLASLSTAADVSSSAWSNLQFVVRLHGIAHSRLPSSACSAWVVVSKCSRTRAPIARVNRPHGDEKTYGLVVDYWGVSADLQDALAVFSTTDVQGALTPNVDELPRLQSRHAAVMRFFQTVADTTDLDACVRVLEPEDVRTAFDLAFRRFSQSMDMLLPDQRALAYHADLRWLGKIRGTARARYRDDRLDLSGCGEKVRKLIADAVVADGIQILVKEVQLFSPEFEEKVAALATDDAKASEMEHAIRHEINVRVEENPVFYQSLRERLEEIIAERRQERMDAAEQLSLLSSLRDDLKAEQTRAQDIGLDARSFAIYGLLERQRPGKTKEKTATYDVANRDLASLIDEAVTPFTDLVDWQQKDDLQRQMRSRIKRQLRAGGIDADTVESLAADIVDLAKVRSDR